MLPSREGIGYIFPMNTPIRRAALAAFFALVFCAGPARADEHEHEHAHKTHAMGLMGVYAAGIHDGEAVHHGGAGLFYKILAIPEWLLVEIAAKAMFSEHGTHIPFELSLRKPFHIGEHIHLAPGIGPLLILAFHDGKTETVFGIGGGVGISYWFTSWSGVKMELGYELHFEEELSHELVVAAGAVFGW
jgi:hypothetical protein